MTEPLRPDICRNINVFVFIPTRPNACSLRSVIRKTWAQNPPSDVLIRFVIGRPQKNGSLSKEHKRYGDMIFYDLDDTYRNLYLKIYAGFQWQQTFCPNAKFVMKIDDDMIADIHRLKYWINKKMTPLTNKYRAIIFGTMFHRMQPIRNKNSKYFISHSDYSPEVYPPYQSGPCYILSSDAVAAITKYSHKAKAFEIEDALYTGVIADIAGIRRENLWRHFRTTGKFQQKEDCDERKVPLVLTAGSSRDLDNYRQNFAYLTSIDCQ
ncbi:galactosyltransferase domain-containing protein [Ditylenchus destructor]|uniref:Hexosyltransferase n=1 Tax=Ditylenchus destructor TaxID=166010 RepID=A0AAD4QYA1_9BILA|nr:galactosyltransferase domain-containing protein [Ditylenchus destructor]